MLRKKTLTKYLSRQRRNELEEEKKLGKSKWKRMTAETKRDKGSKKDEKTALKVEGTKKSDRATQHGKEAQISKAPRPRSQRRPANHTKPKLRN